MRSSRPIPLWRQHSRSLLASVFLVLGLTWVMKRGALPLLPPDGSMARVNWVEVGLGVLALVTSTQLRYARYTLLISSIATLSMRRIMVISNIAAALVSFLPFRLGEFARPAMLREKGRISGWAVTGTVGAERIIDAALFGLMLLLGLSLATPHDPLPDHIGTLPVPAAAVPWAAWAMTGAALSAFTLVAVFYRLRETAQAFTEAAIGLVSKRLGVLVASAVARASQGFGFLANVRQTSGFLAASVFALFLHVVGLWLLAGGVGLTEVTLVEAAVMTGVLGLAFALPNAPGFFGSVQMALYAGLTLYVPPERVVQEGAVLVFLFYLSYLGMTITGALTGLFMQSREVAVVTLVSARD